MLRIIVTTLLFCLMAPLLAADIETGDPALDTAFAQLRDRNFDTKAEGVAALASSGHPKTLELLHGLLKGELRYLKSNKRLVWLHKRDGKSLAVDVLTGQEHGAFSKRKFKKLAINNAMRSQIRVRLAELELGNPDPVVRLTAVDNMLANPEPQHAELFTRLLKSETDPAVREVMQSAIDIARLTDPVATVRKAAIANLEGSLKPAVRNSLTRLAESDPDAEVRTAAAASLETIEARVELFGHIETLFFGLSLGSVLVLAAIGLAITFGVMGVINMAHGELIMLGAYTTYLIQQAMPEHDRPVDSARRYRPPSWCPARSVSRSSAG